MEMCTRVGLVITDTALGPVEEGVEAEEVKSPPVKQYKHEAKIHFSCLTYQQTSIPEY